MVEKSKAIIASGMARSRCSNDASGVVVSPLLSSAFHCVGFTADKLFQGKATRSLPKLPIDNLSEQ